MRAAASPPTSVRTTSRPPPPRERPRPLELELAAGPRLADVGRRLDGGEPFVHAGEGDDAAGEEVLRERLRERSGEDRERAPPGSGSPQGGPERVEGHVPLRVLAAVAARRIGHEQGEVEAAAEHGGERGVEALPVAPDEGVEVEGVGDVDEVVHGRRHPRTLGTGERSRPQPPPVDGVRHEGRLAARAAQRGDVAARKRTRRVEQLERLEEGGKGVGAGDAGARRKERAGARLRAGERGAVCDTVRRAPLVAPAELAGGERNPACARLAGGGGKPLRIVQGLDDEPDGGDAVVVEEGIENLGGADAGPVAEGHHHGDGHCAPVHGEGDREVAALGHDGDPRGSRRTPPTSSGHSGAPAR